MKQGKLIEIVLAGIPYPEQIKNIDIDTESEAIRFTWRGVRYRVSGSGFVEEIGDGVLIGSDRAILMRHILQKTSGGVNYEA